ncbi:MAG: ATP-binding protein [Thermogutta sp.]|nr:ATP-binding protein [Thermogutta sp.]HPU04978.1 ATP-binding protein [Thermogutta sp.]HQF14844.1 ATP-binding protein [Thermogutta sp.]
MPQRRLNRALVETSLEVKCLFLFGVFLVLVIAVSVLLYWRVTGEVVTRQNPDTARLLVDQVMLTKHYAAMEPNKDFVDYLNGVIKSRSQQGYRWRFVRPPGRLMNQSEDTGPPLDAMESELIQRFMAMTEEERSHPDAQLYAERLVDGGNTYQYYQPIWAEQSCVPCHIALEGAGYSPTSGGIMTPIREGDLMAILQVTIPNGPTQAAVMKYWSMLLAVAIVTAFLAMIAFYITIRYVIVRPLRHLRAVSEAITEGNTALRAHIHTRDEFELLANAFNRMLSHLVAVQDELRQVNAELDAKLDEVAQLNMQLYEMNRVKSDFMATMSHELRTPLNSILGFSEVLASIESLDEKQRRYVQNIQKSGRILLEMINNVLDLAKMEAGRMEIRPTEFSIEQVVQAQCDMARPLTEKKNLQLTVDIQPNLPPMFQDQNRVAQILNNLLSNAIKFTPEGGAIRVIVRRDNNGDLILRVADTGVGIAEEDRQIIFEKFRQGRTAMPDGDPLKREYPGSGLGLSIVKELCRLLGGEVGVESELGRGSVFTVRLPWRLEIAEEGDQPPYFRPINAEEMRFDRDRVSKRLRPTPASEKGPR